MCVWGRKGKPHILTQDDVVAVAAIVSFRRSPRSLFPLFSCLSLQLGFCTATSTFCPGSLSTHLSRSFGQHARFCECSCLCDIDRCCLILLPHFVQTLVQFSQRHTISWRLSLERRKIDLGNPRFRLQMPVNDPLAHFPPSPPLPLAQKVIAVPDMLPLFRHLNLTVAIIFLSSLAFTGIRTSSIFLGQKMTKR